VFGRATAFLRGVVWRHWKDEGFVLDVQKRGEDDRDCIRFMVKVKEGNRCYNVKRPNLTK